MKIGVFDSFLHRCGARGAEFCSRLYKHVSQVLGDSDDMLDKVLSIYFEQVKGEYVVVWLAVQSPNLPTFSFEMKTVVMESPEDDLQSANRFLILIYLHLRAKIEEARENSHSLEELSIVEQLIYTPLDKWMDAQLLEPAFKELFDKLVEVAV